MRSATTPVTPHLSSIKRARTEQGITVKELALRLQVTPGAVSHLERSEQRGAIRIATLRNALAAMGAELPAGLQPAQQPHVRAPFERREERVTFELHRAVAKKLIDDPAGVLRVIPENLSRLRQHVHGTLVHGWIDRWETLSHGSVGGLIDAMLATDELGIEMRQSSPFMGVLTQQERLEAIRRAAP